MRDIKVNLENMFDLLLLGLSCDNSDILAHTGGIIKNIKDSDIEEYLRLKQANNEELITVKKVLTDIQKLLIKIKKESA